MFLLKFKINTVISITIIFLIVSGCATTPIGSLQISYDQQFKAGGWPDKNLEAEFRKYWIKRFSGNIEETYSMESPSFREMVSLPKYRTVVQHTVKTKHVAVEIYDIQYVSEFLVKIDCGMQLDPDASANAVSIADRWVFVGGGWYHVLRDPFFPL